MGTTAEKSIPLIVAIIFSLIFHVSIIAGVPLFRDFNFERLLSNRTLYAKIISESSQKNTSQGPTRKAPVHPSPPENILLNDKPPETENAFNGPSDKDNLLLNDGIAEQISTEDNSEISPNKENAKDIAKNELPPAKKEGLIQLLSVSKESFFYDIYWLGIHVGNAVLEASNSKGLVRITSQVHSAPFISTFYKVEDYAESNVINGRPATFKIKQREGKKRSDKETFFNIENQTVLHINHIKETNDTHSINTDMLWDVISGFYYLRTQKLNIGETVYINIFDSNKFYQAEVQVVKKDAITLPDEKEIQTIMVKPLLKSEGLFQNKGDISIWLTDDEAKTPVQVETEAPIGKVTAKLKNIEIEK
ncbi:MAG: DUF3108 domain-containing protein [Nitrospirae bacterium]|nr:MAG: DUF3108 domain-containing protein [Nitrospirota bacterium]